MNKVTDFLEKYRLANHVTIIYVIFGMLWILLSDRILSIFVTDVDTMAFIQTIKGNAYVFLTAALLWGLIFNGLTKINEVSDNLRSSLARYQSHYDQGLVGILALDRNLIVRETNPRAQVMFQGNAAILLGRPIADLFEWNESLEAILEDSDHNSREVRVRCADGQRMHALLSISPVRNQSGQVAEYMVYLQEIEALKQYETALLKINAQLEKRVKDRTRQLEVSNQELTSSLQDQRGLTTQLERTNQDLRSALDHTRKLRDRMVYTERMTSLGNMVAGLAHELNTPLGAAKTAGSYVDREVKIMRNHYNEGAMTKRDFLDFMDQMEESAQIIDRNVSNASDMMLRFKKMATDQTKQELINSNVLDTIHNVQSSLKHYLKRKQITYKLNIDKDLIVSYPSGVLSQIFSNLLLNAVVHGFSDRDKGTIGISASKTEEDFTIIFEDDGRGVDPEDLPHIFEPFFSTADHNEHEQAGAGLGLYLVRSIVQEQMNGTITCESIRGEKTRFTLISKL